MTTARQIKKLVRRTLSSSNELVHLERNVLWHLPIRHVARTIAILRCRNHWFFSLKWFLTGLYMHDAWPTRGLGHYSAEFYRSDYQPNPGGGNLWEWADPSLEEAFFNCVESDVLPLMRSVTCARSAVEYIRASEDRLICFGWDRHVVTSIALGEFDAARALWLPHAAPFVKGKVVSEHYQRTYDRLCELGEPLMADDRAALAALLHRWEAENVRGTALEPYWQPTPFPFEVAA
ncbi:hypothetical protein [Methylobacterium nigriterrae]|uniref:hypothetical protein n=1 Tax=Methylobacterium nigriterrae TaxID=3127512 RepID=UPI003013D752